MNFNKKFALESIKNLLLRDPLGELGINLENEECNDSLIDDINKHQKRWKKSYFSHSQKEILTLSKKSNVKHECYKNYVEPKKKTESPGEN